jgi:threonine/homoserine/homoserine lactone efflux protein
MTGLPAFYGAMLLLFITPGPDMLYVIARSIGQGRAAGLASALGIGIGCFFHIFAVAFGFAGLLRATPIAYRLIRYAGAAYLVYLGGRTLLSRGAGDAKTVVAPAGMWRVFAQGAVTNILNPKVALFFLAFLPQFVSPRGSAFAQTVKLGLILDGSGTLFNMGVAMTASTVGVAIRSRVGSDGTAASAIRRLMGGVFVGLGLWLAARRDG